MNGPAPREFYVVRVNGAAGGPFGGPDTYAADTLDDALALAMPDPGDLVEWGTVWASDAGAARLMAPRRRWQRTVKRAPIEPPTRITRGWPDQS